MNSLFCNNYTDINSLELYLSEIEKSLELKMYFSALHMSLSIPDMLGKIAYKNNNENRYIKWFDENVKNCIFGYLYSKSPFLDDRKNNIEISGKICYALRCKLFHEGKNDLYEKNQLKIDEFVISFTDEDYVRGNYAGIKTEYNDYNSNKKATNEIKYLYISCKGLCREITNAAKEFVKNNPDLDYPKIRVNQYGGRTNLF